MSDRPISFVLFLILGVIVSIGMIILAGGDILNDKVYLTLGINGAIFVGYLLTSIFRQKLSLALIYWFFSFVFFFTVPLIQYSNRLFIYSKSNPVTDEYMFYANLVILLWNVVFLGMYELVYQNFSLKPVYRKITSSINTNLVLYGIFCIVAVLFTLSFLGTEGFLFRKGKLPLYNISGSMYLVYTKALLPLFMFVFLIFYVLKRRYSNLKIQTLLLLSLPAIAFNLPTANARFYTFAILLAVYATIFMRREKNGLVFLFYFPLGIIGVTLLNAFRWKTSFTSGINVSLADLFPALMDFDAYEMLTLACRYVDDNGVMVGKNLLGALFFFVPRSIWPTKPIGSGSIIVQDQFSSDYWYFRGFSKDFFNVSCPLVAEYYLAFGLLGIVFGAMLSGGLISLLDNSFRKYFLKKVIHFDLFKILYGALAGLLLFNLRGDLLSSTAYIFGFIIAYLVALRIMGLGLNMKLLKV